MKKLPKIIFGSPDLGAAEIREVVSSMRAGWIGTGPKVRHFEERFARHAGVRFAIALNSCTSALRLALQALDIRKGDEVIVPDFTFTSTAAAVLHAGGTPIFADVDRRTMNVNAETLESKISKRTKALLPVHFAGRMCPMDEILGLARKHRLRIVEDCSHAAESAWRGQAAGSFGDAGCFSFYATKNIVTGEGGMVTTRHAKVARTVRLYSMHGLDHDAWSRHSSAKKGFTHYQAIVAGHKVNMTDIAASLGIHQLAHVLEHWRKRRAVWRTYQRAFKDLPLQLPSEPGDHERHAYHLYTPLLKLEDVRISRDTLLDRLLRKGVGVGVHYRALHLQPLYQKMFSLKSVQFPHSDWLSRRTFSLPISSKLTARDVQRVVEAVRTALH